MPDTFREITSSIINQKKPYLIKFVLLIITIVAIFLAGSFLGPNFIFKDNPLSRTITGKAQNRDKYMSFFFEVYDLVKQNYWNILTDEQLNDLVRQSIEKIVFTPLPVTPGKTQPLAKTLLEVTKDMNDGAKKEFYVKLADTLLANLEPFGRSRLYSAKQTQDLSNTVKNIDPAKDRYGDLGVNKAATKEEIDNAFKQKEQEVQREAPSPEKDEKLAEIQKSYEILNDRDTKKVYDESGVEPTFTYKIYYSSILYLQMSKFSPTSVQDMVRVADKANGNTKLDALIIDLRGNIGGLIDGIPYLLGPFIGNDQYVYQFFNRGEKLDFKTKVGKIPSLARYKKVVVLIDGASQSSAEVFASSLRKYNVGVLVGEKTKGWGTVEKVLNVNTQIDSGEKYSVLLVHSLTLQEDGRPIEGNGVEPDINIKTPGWEKALYERFNYQNLVNAVKELVS